MEALQAVAPRGADTQLLAADISWCANCVRDSTACALDAVQSACADPELACDVAASLLRVGEVVAARRYLTRLATTGAMSRAGLLRLADFRPGFGEYTGSLALPDAALATGSEAATIHFYRGRLLTFRGRLAEVGSEYLHSLRLDPAQGEVALALVTLRTQAPDDNCQAASTAGLQNVGRGTRDHAAFEFARHKSLDEVGKRDEAWCALASANAIMHERARGIARIQKASLQRSHEYHASHPLPRAGTVQTRPQPIFIIGLPHSGTTVLERLPSNHTQITAAGELFDSRRQLQWAGDHRSIQGAVFFATS